MIKKIIVNYNSDTGDVTTIGADVFLCVWPSLDIAEPSLESETESKVPNETLISLKAAGFEAKEIIDMFQGGLL